jgi:hypothetical protein
MGLNSCSRHACWWGHMRDTYGEVVGSPQVAGCSPAPPAAQPSESVPPAQPWWPVSCRGAWRHSVQGHDAAADMRGLSRSRVAQEPRVVATRCQGFSHVQPLAKTAAVKRAPPSHIALTSRVCSSCVGDYVHVKVTHTAQRKIREKLYMAWYTGRHGVVHRPYTWRIQ